MDILDIVFYILEAVSFLFNKYYCANKLIDRELMRKVIKVITHPTQLFLSVSILTYR